MYKYVCSNCGAESYTSQEYKGLIKDKRNLCDICNHEVYPAELIDFIKDNQYYFDKYYFCIDKMVEQYKKKE